MRKLLYLAVLGLAVIALILGPATISTRAADHLDAPLVAADGRIDINDVYVFQSPSNPANTVLVMTVNPAAGLLSGTRLRPGAQYEFLVDTTGDAVQDIAYRLKFT